MSLLHNLNPVPQLISHPFHLFPDGAPAGPSASASNLAPGPGCMQHPVSTPGPWYHFGDVGLLLTEGRCGCAVTGRKRSGILVSGLACVLAVAVLYCGISSVLYVVYALRWVNLDGQGLDMHGIVYSGRRSGEGH